MEYVNGYCYGKGVWCVTVNNKRSWRTSRHTLMDFAGTGLIYEVDKTWAKEKLLVPQELL